MENLEELILEASARLDPSCQGVQWPCPHMWDGRTLEEQAADISKLLAARAEDLRDRGEEEKANHLLELEHRLRKAAKLPE